LGVKQDFLRNVARNIHSHYKTFPLRVGSKVRMLTVPDAELKNIQSLIHRNIISKIALAPGVYGGVRGGSPRKNASEHLNQACVVNMDVKEFFPNVRHYMVYRMFTHELRFGRDVASLLTRLTTHQSCLPQGAPTSTCIANLLLAQTVDGPVRAETKLHGLHYSRFVDDIAISGNEPLPLISFIAKRLSRRRLPMHRYKAGVKTKLQIVRSGRAQKITGLIVNAPHGLSVALSRRDKIRSDIWALRHVGKHELLSSVNSIYGKINYVKQFNPGAARRLKAYLESTLARTQSPSLVVLADGQ
jgi:hypothetical protein